MSISARPEPVRSCPDWVPEENRTLGWKVLEWTSDYLQQPDGPAAGSHWVYTMEQVRVVLRWYAIDEAGRFLYRRGVLRRMKGWGKSPFLASLAAVELIGPCRFGGWNADGTPKVITHGAPWVQIAATNQDQTRNTMTVFPGLFSAKAVQEYDLDLGKTIIYARKGAARIEAVTSSARGLEGGRPSLMIADETQHWLPSNEGPAMMAVASRNLAKSRDGSARMIEITNAHLVDEGSVAEATYEAWRQADGKLDGVYYDATEAAPVLDEDGQHLPLPRWSDEQLRDGLIAARGDSTWLDVDRLLAEMRDPTTSESHSRRFYLNQVWASANEEWLPVGSWASQERKVSIPPGSDVILAVDGSYNDDSTGIVAASLTEPVHLETVWCFEPDPSLRNAEARTVPIEEAEAAIRAACRKWRVREIAFDPYRWARTMQALAREGLPVVEFPNAQPLDEPVLTPAGWRPIGSLRVGDPVIGGDGRATTVTQVHDFAGERPVFAVRFTDGATTRCTAEHLWLTSTPQQRYQRRAGTVRRLAEITRRGLHVGRASSAFIPLVGAAELDAAELPLDPYVLGVLLGDGNFSGRATPRFASVDQEIVDEVDARLPDGVHLSPQGSGPTVHYALSGPRGAAVNPVTAALRELGLYGLPPGGKFIPEIYLHGSAGQRLDVLRGLMDTDGTVDRRCGAPNFHTTTPALRDGLVALVRSLGGVARVSSERPAKGIMTRPAWVVSVSLPGLNPFILSRKAAFVRRKLPPHRAFAAVEPAGSATVRCITVANEDGLYVTRDYVVTHNSPERMIEATQRFQTAVANGTVTHSGDLRMARHVGNCVIKETSRGRRIVKETKWSPRKIDLAIAAVMAHDRAADRPTGIAAGWLAYMRAEVNKGADPAPTDVAPPVAQPAAPLMAGEAPIVLSPRSCQHRWFDGVCVHCHVTRES